MKLTMTEVICVAALGLFAMSTHAVTDPEKQNKANYSAAIARADADFKVASQACNGQKGNDKDVCIQQAKANRDTAKADAKAALKSKDAIADAREDKAEAQYKVAKEKCDAMSGDAKDACVKEAKIRYHQL